MNRGNENQPRLAKLGLALIGVAIIALMALFSSPLYAAGISVDAGVVAINGADGQCSLIEAIINANDNAATHPDCASGSGADTLVLPAAGTFTLTASFASYSGPTGLPQITSDITIDGNGSTITRDAAAANFRLIAVGGSGTLTLNSVILSNGVGSDRGGGALFSDGGAVTINDSTLSGNNANNSEGGGAIRPYGGTLIINRSTLTNNEASNSNGGGAFNASNNAVITVNQSVLDNNGASNTSGGAIAQYSGTITLNNSTISNNASAGSGGGGIYTQGNTLNLNNVTITGNTSTNAGGGLLNNGATVYLNRTIISGNAAPSYTGSEVVHYSGTTNANNYNVFGYSGLTNITAFAYGFTPGASDFNATSNGTPTALASILNTTLTNNGGPTRTHALVSGSPALDFGPSSACSAAPINGVDQRDYPRNTDADGSVTSNECDSGAYEYGTSAPTETHTPTSTPTDTPTNTPTSTPTDTPTSTPTNTPTSTPTDTPTSTPTNTPTSTPTNTPTSTPTNTPTSTPTNTPTSTSTAANFCPAGPNVDTLMTDLMGTGQGSPSKGVRTRRLAIPNYNDVASLYGQLASVESGGVMKYVRFRYPNGTYEQIKDPTSPAYRYFAVNWWGDWLETGHSYIKGQFFWGAQGSKMPRAFVLWPTYNTAEPYANVFTTFGESIENHVAWEAGFIPTQTQVIPIPQTQAAGATVIVRFAVVDNNKDARPLLIDVTVGSQTQSLADTNPNAKDILNLYELSFANVEAGVNEVTIALNSPIPSAQWPQGGDSAAIIGAAVSYACALPVVR